ncbi:SDR family NAD(P)-dependent oxidoreductase [Castellaniella sp.]|uniref:SDR family NAD(P)-dependent oxidoreductase n=1 Tax=Castellaniella sp. TaxID=1955812 RepID=UPI00355CF395
MIRFDGKTALITGATGGIGREVARLMGHAGAHLALCDKDSSRLSALQHELETLGQPISQHAADLSDASACQATIDATAGAHGGIDYVIHAAGIYPEQLMADMTPGQWRELMAINLDACFYLYQAVIPHLNPDSAIVTLSSMAGHRGSYAHAHYAASKGAVSSLSKSLARELAPRTRVNIVSPGIIATPMTDDLIRQRGPELLQGTPMGRFGKASEVAGAVAFLCSDLASYMTGETLHVNGGLYIV